MSRKVFGDRHASHQLAFHNKAIHYLKQYQCITENTIHTFYCWKADGPHVSTPVALISKPISVCLYVTVNGRKSKFLDSIKPRGGHQVADCQSRQRTAAYC